MISNETIKQRLAKEIKHSNMSQNTIAQKIGVKQSQISRYLNCKSLPSIEMLANLCKLLELDANYILGITEN